MKTKLKLLWIVAGTSLLLAGCCTSHQTAQWEYKVVLAPRTGGGGGLGDRQALLNDLGKEGWMLVAVGDSNDLYLKRPKR